MPTELQMKAKAAVASTDADPNTAPNDPRGMLIQATYRLRQDIGVGQYSLIELRDAVRWAMEQRVTFADVARYAKPAKVGWLYEFPNGRGASVIVDHRTPFRFEVLSDLGQGGLTTGLTSEAVEALLVDIYSLPAA